MATSPRASTLEDELDEEQLFNNVNGLMKQNSVGHKGANGTAKQA